MKDLALHLRTLEDLERTSIPGLVEVPREEGIDVVRYAVWGATGWHRGYSSPALRRWALRSRRVGVGRPPVLLFRRLGVRTRREIDREKFALKVLRGNVDQITLGAGMTKGRR
jgi:hypothetical protein